MIRCRLLVQQILTRKVDYNSNLYNMRRTEKYESPNFLFLLISIKKSLKILSYLCGLLGIYELWYYRDALYFILKHFTFFLVGIWSVKQMAVEFYESKSEFRSWKQTAFLKFKFTMHNWTFLFLSQGSSFSKVLSALFVFCNTIFLHQSLKPRTYTFIPSYNYNHDVLLYLLSVEGASVRKLSYVLGLNL